MAPDEQLRATERRFIERWRLVSPTETRKGGGTARRSVGRSVRQACRQEGRQVEGQAATETGDCDRRCGLGVAPKKESIARSLAAGPRLHLDVDRW